MARMTSTKAAPKAARNVAALAAKRDTGKQFLRFYCSDELRAKTLAVLSVVEQAPDPAEHADALADLVVQLTGAGMDYYFMRPIATAKAGFVTQQSAKLGLAGSMQVMGSVIRNIVGRMEAKQLLSVCGSLREFMH